MEYTIELEELLLLLRKHGVSRYKTENLELEFGEVEEEDGDFGIDISQLQVFGDEEEIN